MRVIRTDQLPTLYGTYRSRYAEWDARKDKIDLVVQGKFNQVDPDEDPIDSRSPNLIQVALEDTTEAASIMPTIRVLPFGTGERAKSQAARQERVAVSYFDVSRMDMLITQTVMDQAAMGMAAWVIYPDRDQKVPIIEWRDPRTCYPEPGYRPGEKVKRCMFARKLFMSQLPPAWQMQIALNVTDPGFESAKAHTPLIIVEFMDAEETYVGALWQGGSPSMEAYEPVELERIPNKVGICPVVVGSRITLDREFRGQFDQVVGTLLAHVRLMGMVLDYADQAVYSDVWVKDLIGDMPYGGGAYIELGPQGAIGRVPPAVTSLTIGQDLQTLEDAIHLGGRWPKSRPGEVSQSIASAKFIEAAAGMMNTAIKCLAPSTRVLTENLEYVPVGELAVGDRLAAFDEYPEGGSVHRNWRSAEVLATGRDMLDSYRVTLEDGTVIDSSAEHLWLCRSGNKHEWRKTEELFTRHGKYNPHRVMKLLDVWEQDYSWASGYLAGMFDGEGCLSMSGRGAQLGLDQKDNEALCKVEAALSDLGFEFTKYLKPNDCWHLNVLGGRKEILRLLGTVRPQRLLARYAAQGGADSLGRLYGETVAIANVEHIGLSEVVTLSTSSETLVAEGFAHHNTYHQILQRMMEQALHICFVTDQKFFPGLKTASGILRNQEFLQEYDSVKDIDLRNRVRVEYGLGLGRDPSQSAVLMLQYAQNNYISKEFVQENIDGLVDVGRERTRLDVEKLSDMAFAKLLQGLQDGSIPQDALVKIAQARENGEGIFALIDKFVVQPAAQAGAGQLASGLGGGPVMPGRPGPGGGPALPPGPPGQPGGGGAPTISPPPPPAVTELMSRLNLPVGPSGSKLGVQTTVG